MTVPIFRVFIEAKWIFHLNLKNEAGLEFPYDSINVVVLDDHLLVMAFDLLICSFLDLFG